MRRLRMSQHGEHLSFGLRGASAHERRGCIEVVCGSMFSGKTEELLRRRHLMIEDTVVLDGELLR